MSYERHDLYRRAQAAIAQASLTNSKRPKVFVVGVSPTHAKSGSGAILVDHLNQRYIDMICGLGAHLFGMNNAQINQAVKNQLDLGSIYSLGSELEVRAAEKLKELIPFVDKVRFLKTGTEATQSAIRIARAVTERTQVLSDGYHGHSDIFIQLTPPHLGVPVDGFVDKFISLDQITQKTAAVIIEPVITEMSSTRALFLSELRRKCDETGTMLIFDEIITGFRVPKLSISECWGVRPDIILFGKAIGGGLPLSAIGLSIKAAKPVEYFVSSTFAGDCLSLAAFLEVSKMARDSIENLWKDGKDFLDQFNNIEPTYVRLEGYPTRSAFKFKDDLTKALFFQECHKARILVGPSLFFSTAHQPIYKQLIGTFRDVLKKIKIQKPKLEGEMPESPFAEKVRQK